MRTRTECSPGGKEHARTNSFEVGYSVRQPRYLRYLSKTGGFASPPLGGFALSLSKAAPRKALQFQRREVNKLRSCPTIDGLRTSEGGDIRPVPRTRRSAGDKDQFSSLETEVSRQAGSQRSSSN